MMMRKKAFGRKSLAHRYRAHIRKYFLTESGSEEREEGIRVDRFVRIQLCWIALGALVLLTALIMLIVSALTGPGEIRLVRNLFGEGERSVPLILISGEREKEILLDVEEITPAEKEIQSLYHKMFRDIRDIMKGKNPSLGHITQPLNFPDTIPGYPFRLTYEVENPEWISSSGTLTENLPFGTGGKTAVKVVAVYGNYRQERIFRLSITGRKETETEDPFFETIGKLETLEKEQRSKREFVIPAMWRGIRIRQKDIDHKTGKVLADLFILLMTVPVFRHLSLREREKRIREETERDFSLIVHLLVVFTGAGLSFLSVVRRISREYRKGRLVSGKRYAFEQILQLEDWMNSGYGQKEAVRRWAGRYPSESYQKLSLILIQSFSKGAREAGQMMEQEEYRAFRNRVNQARKEGERAQTGLLLPMIVMLFITMLMIIFPAMIRFYNT